ncbi:MAG: universal stress protein [Acidobacteriota bacterium]|nr:universal stress protein [Acidobacteriota bacterium]
MNDFRHILFPVDFSERSRSVAPFVLSLARGYSAKVTLLHAMPIPMPYWSDLGMMPPIAAQTDDLRGQLTERLKQFAADLLPKVDTLCAVEAGEPGSLIVAQSAMAETDLIAMPTHGYGMFRRALLGSVTAKVLHDAAAPVWTSAHAPEPSHRAHPKPRRILAAVDLKDESARVLDYALGLAHHEDASVEVLYVAPEGQIAEHDSAARLDQLLSKSAYREKVTVLNEMESGPEVTVSAGIAETIRTLAVRKRVDLVVIGRGGIRGLGPTRMNSHAYAIVREAPCPVLSV